MTECRGAHEKSLSVRQNARTYEAGAQTYMYGLFAVGSVVAAGHSPADLIPVPRIYSVSSSTPTRYLLPSPSSTDTHQPSPLPPST